MFYRPLGLQMPQQPSPTVASSCLMLEEDPESEASGKTTTLRCATYEVNSKLYGENFSMEKNLYKMGFECTVGPLDNGKVGDEHFVHFSEVVPSSEV